jgi:predicted ferric reductase
MAARNPRATRMVIALFWLGLAITIALWWADTPRVNGNADWLTGAGRLAGLAGGYVLLIQMILMSRVPDKWLDASKISLWHRDLGGYLIVVLVTHAVLITAGYAAQDGSGFFAQAWTLLSTYEDMITAFLALTVLLAVGLLAMRWVRRRMRYETFYYVHLSVYLAAFLAYAHQFSTGAQFAHAGLPRVWWIGLYVLALASLAYGRVLRPLVFNLRHQARVAAVVPEAPGVVSVYVTGFRLSEMDVQAGQFFRWRFLTRDGWWQAHPFSLSAAPNPQWLRLTVKTLGDHSRALTGLRPGVRVWLEGPAGGFTARSSTQGNRALLIAGGIGIAPVRALLEDLPPGGQLLYRASGADDLVFRQELEALAAGRGHQLRYLVGSRRDPAVRQALSADGLRGMVPDVKQRDVYVCGPAGMVTGVVDALRTLRVPRRQIHLDPFEL